MQLCPLTVLNGVITPTGNIYIYISLQPLLYIISPFKTVKGQKCGDR